mgnify:CR=1 FL=1
MKIEVTKSELSLIIVALKAMKETYYFIRGWGKIGREEQMFEDLIEKLENK